MATDRRVFIRNILLGVGIITISPKIMFATEKCNVLHPFMPPNSQFSGECHNCGMKRPMWARTWHTYSQGDSVKEVCSIHCLAEASLNSGISPKNVKVALYLKPEVSIPVDEAFYVIGSKARGTMTMKSKLAFASKKEAQQFSDECGGSVTDFSGAYTAAMSSIAQENQMINKNRLAKGKIVEPKDDVDLCPVCDMYPARYPKNKCQLQTADGRVIHFCSTQCLFEYLKNPDRYGGKKVMVKFMWVVDFSTEQWIYAQNAYYVTGSNAAGPMGKEAFPFVSRKNAETFAANYSGKVRPFKDVTIDEILN